MTRMAFLTFLLFFMVLGSAFSGENATTGTSKPTAEQAKATEASSPPTFATSSGKFPLDIQSKGDDSSGTLLSYKLKEEIVASALFDLKISDKKKFVLRVLTQPEFPDRPGLSSMYSIALVYQEDASTLAYLLDQYQGQVHPEAVTTEMQKILEWSYPILKRYHYLLEE